ncbi:uncharacterized protein LTR77_004805 [Saxophila tyrrhenica]|uniref:Phosphoinositide phospholipase C n=1 Tax=Saxophila tyrrhenica TaxID=1690608 RepID=A0AAV9PA30_9PEZI|nr:hypothetical protein LTR77_004805 [Saxophila tyrrhenica]
MRDQSAGPVLVRRRSDSNTTSEVGQDMSDLELDNTTEEKVEEPYTIPPREPPNGLGISIGRPSNASAGSENRVAPAVSAILRAGTIWLDPNSARVCWHSTNPSKSFFIDDVRDVRVGAESRNARDDAKIPDEHESRWVTIVYEPPERSKGRTIKTMHLIMDSKMIVDYWTEALGNVTRERTEIMSALTSSPEKSERGMAIAWTKTMTRPNRQGPTGEDCFTLEDATWLCARLEINCSNSAVKTHFMRSDSRNTGSLNYTQYMDFVNSFKERKDIQNLFTNISCGTDNDVRLDDFLAFLSNDQKINVEKERAHWEGVFERFSRVAPSKSSLPDAVPVPGERTMNMQGFQNFLTSSYNSPVPGSKAEPTLNRPLNEYFISSSHNTYLLGRQVAGASSVEGYIAALIKGCRCIEIDCWDGEGGRPTVTHGRTMSTKVPFEDCVSTIGKYAFHSSSYPLIVSLEVHCNPEQQRAMVDIMLKYWKGALVEEPLTNDALTLPSPDELKNRILVKVKVAEEAEPASLQPEMPNGRSRARSLGSAFTRTSSLEKYPITATPPVMSPPTMSPLDTTVSQVGTPRGSIASGSAYTPPSTSSDDSDDVLTSASEKPRKPKSSKIVPELGRLGVYVQGIKYGGFQAPEAKTFNHIFSFSENTFDSLCTKSSGTKSLLELHNLRHLMRVYPSAKRITSGNFDPMDPWRRGVQMVALNWQTYDVHQQINEAMFASGSDRVGYVLKPEELRPAKHLPIADTLPSALEKRDKKGKVFIRFTVDIKSAQRLPRPRPQSGHTTMNPYIEMEMYCAEDKARGIAKGHGGFDASSADGFSGISSPVRRRTKISEGNGFDPIWNSPVTMAVGTRTPSLIFVRWTVWNSSDGHSTGSDRAFLGTFTAKLDSLQQGYRHLPLFTAHGEQFRDAKLFVKITKEAPLPLQHDGTSNGFVADPMPSPRPEPRPDPPRSERSWGRRVFGRNSSQRRLDERQQDGYAGVLSRTSSTDRDSIR